MRVLLLSDSFEDNVIIYVILFIICLFITALITRWIFRIDEQVRNQRASLFLLTKLCEKQGVSKEEIKQWRKDFNVIGKNGQTQEEIDNHIKFKEKYKDEIRSFKS
jgi:hypothetical protein